MQGHETQGNKSKCHCRRIHDASSPAGNSLLRNQFQRIHCGTCSRRRGKSRAQSKRTDISRTRTSRRKTQDRNDTVAWMSRNSLDWSSPRDTRLRQLRRMTRCYAGCQGDRQRPGQQSVDNACGPGARTRSRSNRRSSHNGPTGRKIRGQSNHPGTLDSSATDPATSLLPGLPSALTETGWPWWERSQVLAGAPTATHMQQSR